MGIKLKPLICGFTVKKSQKSALHKSKKVINCDQVR